MGMQSEVRESLPGFHSSTIGWRKLFETTQLITDLHSGQSGRIRLVPFPVEVAQNTEDGNAGTDRRKVMNVSEEVSITFPAIHKHAKQQQLKTTHMQWL